MATLEVELERNLSRGDKKVNGFSGAIRSLENLGLEVGDEFTFPENYDVYEQKIGDNTVQYIMVTLKNGNAKPFYPSTFTKSRTVYNADKTSTGIRKHTMGTAAELFRSFGEVQKGMDALRIFIKCIYGVKVADSLIKDDDGNFVSVYYDDFYEIGTKGYWMIKRIQNQWRIVRLLIG